MKKKILGAALMAAVALAAGWNINQSENEVKLSDLALDNVEALASGEGGSSGYCNRSGAGCIIRYSDGSSTYIPNRWN
ncbi:MAG: NVEALA domain-containing protein [Parabacteroides sp.]|nr:NVEALA domain-containing protein [Parabacteroides sp.]